MSKQILRRFSKITLIDQLSTQLKETINMFSGGEALPFSGFMITRVDKDEIHFNFSISEDEFIGSITWQRFLANLAFLNLEKFN